MSAESSQPYLDYLQGRPEIVAPYLFVSVAAERAYMFGAVDIALLLADGVDSRCGWEIRLEAMGEAEADEMT